MIRCGMVFFALIAISASGQQSPGPATANDRLNARSLIGEYSYFTGFESASLNLWPNGAYKYEFHSDDIDPRDRTDERGKSYGIYSIQNGSLVLIPKDSKRRKRMLKTPLRLVPARWGDRLYLIEQDRLKRFCESIERGEEPAEYGESNYLLRRGYGSDTPLSPPSLPDKWSYMLRDVEPVTGPIEPGRDYLDRLAAASRKALATGDTKTATRYAAELLRRNRDTREWYHIQIVHEANQTLGLAALHEGRLDDAKGYLLASAKIAGNPWLGREGPRFLLANELLKRGEKETVLEYLDLISGFRDVKNWPERKQSIHQWKMQLRDGKSPTLHDFVPKP